jgi:hypothetical protein
MKLRFMLGYFSLLRSNILLSTDLTHTLKICSLSVTDQISRLYKTKGKVIVLSILIFTFIVWDGKTEDYELNGSKKSPNIICS